MTLQKKVQIMNYGYRGGFYGPYGYAPPRPIRGMGPPGPGPRPLMGPQMRPRWGAAFASLNNGGFDPYSRGPGPQQQQNFCDEFDPETEDVPMHLVTSDHVKDWLNNVDIKYTEGVQSLNWTKIMKTILDDPEGFFEEGGWNFLDSNNSDNDEGEDEEDSEDDEEFQVSESEAASEEVSDSEDDYSSEDISEEDDEGGLDSDESEGKDWSDLEREAAEDDEDMDDDDRHRPSKSSSSRHKSSSKHRSPIKSSSSKHHKSPSKGHRDHRDHKRKREHSSNGKHHKSPKKSRR